MLSISLGFILMGAFALVGCIAALMSLVLFYHWIRYNLGLVSTLFVMVIYTLGLASLIVALLSVATLV